MSGSGGSGGYEYQDNAIGYVAAHILAGESLGWRLETGAPDIPVAVAAETGGPGDDLRITLQNDVVVELQAKHGLQKSKLFEPLLKLVKGLHENPNLYGVLLTDSTASRTIRDHLRHDLIKLGQDRFDRLRPITKEFQDQLASANLPNSSSTIFCRLRIIVLDLDDDLPNAKSAQTLLSKLVSDQHQASTVWKILCDEGRSLNSNPGRRDKQAWYSLLKEHAITFIDELAHKNLEQAINWTELCRKMLPTELEANPLLSGDGVTLDVEDILPLDLVKRKERPEAANDPSPENFQRSLEDQEIPLPYDQLFEEVLIGCQRGKGIALIGEAGTGKTTLLCAIAHWIMKRDELPVFVSLRNLEGKLEDYILETWLKKAISQRKAPERLQDELIEQCNAGRVWLLLDGIDEIGTSQTALYSLSQELREGWLSSNCIAITCRVNIWDASRNNLESNFQYFRSRGFKDEEQIAFIKKFFAKAKQSDIGEHFIRQLKDATLRLKDLIKSPLWMVILCRTWKRRTGKLPETKAELYEGFVATFYDWKDKPDVPKEKRPALEQALGELSKKAIDQKNFRFSLRESFIRQELDRADPSFFDIACKLGWINKLGIAPGNSEEPVYSFLHPTFQEYFAALAIDDWDYFLPRDHEDKLIESKEYRIFEDKWKHVACFWIELNLNSSDAFIESLYTFDNDEIGKLISYYHHTAVIFASIFILRLPSRSKQHIKVLHETIKLALGGWHVSEHIRSFLREEEPNIVCETLRQIINQHLSKYAEPEEVFEALWLLFHLQPREPLNFKLLEEVEIELLNRFPKERWILSKINSIYLIYEPEHPKAITYSKKINQEISRKEFGNIVNTVLVAINEAIESDKMSDSFLEQCNQDELMRVILQASSNREHELSYKNALTRLAQGIMENQDEKTLKFILDLSLIKEPERWRFDSHLKRITLFRVIERFPKIVAHFLRIYATENESNIEALVSNTCYQELIFLCAHKIKYSEFYKIWLQ